ncbi:MAG: aldehyde dehydrogenase family protein [Hyphomicrobiales bacterium]|nr:aldehyde dehydrogenase family protein [Hyphomicrobiales bacterium]
MSETAKNIIADHPLLDEAVSELNAAKDAWARTTIAERIAILAEVKEKLLPISEGWAKTAARKKLIPAGSPLEGEEWLSGPYALMSTCNALMQTLSEMEGKNFLKNLPLRDLTTGQIAAKVIPHSIWDQLLLSGVKAEVWMQKGVTKENLHQHTASVYDTSIATRAGKVSLVLGAGNIAAIAPLDCFQKLFTENQVVILKMNPVNDYLSEYLRVALKPLIDRDALRIVKGGADVGAYLCNHPDIEEIHITGAESSHDAIVWGIGQDAAQNKKAGTPINKRRITSELGAVCPTIVVPGPWSSADLKFQAEHIATQKLHNSGFNCIACQMLILPSDWELSETLLNNVETVMQNCDPRQMYYPGASERISDFESHGDNVLKFERGSAPACVVIPCHDGADAWFGKSEVFAPAMTTLEISGESPEAYLRKAIKYANEELHGTLGANIMIHPGTIRKIGKKRFESIIAELRYGCIAINAWTGLGFLLTQTPWGAFPGHTLDDVQSGIGVVHNSFMFERSERTVVFAPFRPFPRNLLSGGVTLLPRPPWFVTNKKQHKVGMLLTKFQYKPGWLKLPRIFFNALLG